MTDQKINRVCIVGERCSGTTFLHTLLERNLVGCSVTSSDFGWKHGFFRVFGESLLGTDYRNSPDLVKTDQSDIQGTLFIFVIREITEWLKSLNFHRYALQEKKHTNFSRTIREPAVTVNDYDERVEIVMDRDLPFEFDNLTPNIECAKNYPNIIHLRYARMKNYIFLSQFISHVMYVKYEDVQDNASEFVRKISEKFRVSKRDVFVPVEEYIVASFVTDKKFTPSEYPAITEDDMKFIMDQTSMCNGLHLESKFSDALQTD